MTIFVYNFLISYLFLGFFFWFTKKRLFPNLAFCFFFIFVPFLLLAFTVLYYFQCMDLGMLFVQILLFYCLFYFLILILVFNKVLCFYNGVRIFLLPREELNFLFYQEETNSVLWFVINNQTTFLLLHLSFLVLKGNHHVNYSILQNNQDQPLWNIFLNYYDNYGLR